jgi:hypothetical protein
MRNTTRAGALGAAALTALLFVIPSAGASDNAVECPGEQVAGIAGDWPTPCGDDAPDPHDCPTCGEAPVEPGTPDHPCDHCTPDETTPPDTTPPDTTPDVTIEEPPAPTPTPAAVPIAAPAPSVVAVPTYTG